MPYPLPGESVMAPNDPKGNGFPEVNYLIFDGRYRFDKDRAILLATCETLTEAEDQVGQFGDAVIVDAKTGKLVDELDF